MSNYTKNILKFAGEEEKTLIQQLEQLDLWNVTGGLFQALVDMEVVETTLSPDQLTELSLCLARLYNVAVDDEGSLDTKPLKDLCSHFYEWVAKMAPQGDAGAVCTGAIMLMSTCLFINRKMDGCNEQREIAALAGWIMFFNKAIHQTIIESGRKGVA